MQSPVVSSILRFFYFRICQITCPCVHPQPQPAVDQLQLEVVAGGGVVRVHQQPLPRLCAELKTQARVRPPVPFFELRVAGL